MDSKKVSKLSRVADALHSALCHEDHGAMYCMYGNDCPGGKQDTKKWQARAREILNYAKEHRISVDRLVGLIELMGKLIFG